MSISLVRTANYSVLGKNAFILQTKYLFDSRIYLFSCLESARLLKKQTEQVEASKQLSLRASVKHQFKIGEP